MFTSCHPGLFGIFLPVVLILSHGFQKDSRQARMVEQITVLLKMHTRAMEDFNFLCLGLRFSMLYTQFPEEFVYLRK
jgi:hypothetical protein